MMFNSEKFAKVHIFVGAPLVLVITFYSYLPILSPFVHFFLSYISYIISFSIVFLYISKVMTNTKGEPFRLTIV